VLTSVVAVGAMSAIGKGSAVGVLGTSTTTNTYLYVTSKGQLAAAKTFETIVGHMSNLGGTTSSGALMRSANPIVRCNQLRGGDRQQRGSGDYRVDDSHLVLIRSDHNSRPFRHGVCTSRCSRKQWTAFPVQQASLAAF
jgi:hypothetical protein